MQGDDFTEDMLTSDFGFLMRCLEHTTHVLLTRDTVTHAVMRIVTQFTEGNGRRGHGSGSDRRLTGWHMCWLRSFDCNGSDGGCGGGSSGGCCRCGFVFCCSFNPFVLV